jgi:micrococcal nuclease
MNYRYNAKILKIVDGDTVWVEIDLGLRVFCKERVRLLGIDAPEMRGANREQGIASKEYLINLLKNHGNQVIIETKKEGKYGRWLATLFTDDGENINQMMIDGGHAVIY